MRVETELSPVESHLERVHDMHESMPFDARLAKVNRMYGHNGYSAEPQATVTYDENTGEPIIHLRDITEDQASQSRSSWQSFMATRRLTSALFENEDEKSGVNDALSRVLFNDQRTRSRHAKTMIDTDTINDLLTAELQTEPPTVDDTLGDTLFTDTDSSPYQPPTMKKRGMWSRLKRTARETIDATREKASQISRKRVGAAALGIAAFSGLGMSVQTTNETGNTAVETTGATTERAEAASAVEATPITILSPEARTAFDNYFACTVEFGDNCHDVIAVASQQT